MNYKYELMRNCHSLRIDLFTEHEGLHNLVRGMLDELNLSFQGKKRPKGCIAGLEFYQTIKIIFENFIYAKLGLVSLSLSNDYYAKMPKRYNPQYVSAYKLRSIIKYLQGKDLIILHKGVFTKKLCVRTRLEATPKLKEILKATGLKKSELTLNEKMERIILKDKSEDNRKIYIDYEDNEETNGLRKFILDYEIFINKFKFTSSEGKYNRLTFKRVFNNGSFQEGGRFYSDYQNLKSQIRAHTMKCDKVPLKEWDYKGMHINMLYSMKDLPHPEGDVYTIPGYEQYRDLFKIALQIALNATSPTKAVLGMNNHLIKNRINLKEINGKVLLEEFAKKHGPIKDYFFSGVGVHLQYMDSKICKLILSSAMEHDIPVLSVHDSFLCRECDQGFLLEQMRKFSIEVLGQELKTEGK